MQQPYQELKPWELRILAIILQEHTPREVMAIYEKVVKESISYSNAYRFLQDAIKLGWAVTLRNAKSSDGVWLGRVLQLTIAGSARLDLARQQYRNIAEFMMPKRPVGALVNEIKKL